MNKSKTNDKISLFIYQNFQCDYYKTIYIQIQLLQKEIKRKKNLMFNAELQIQILKNKFFKYFNSNIKLDIFKNWKSILSKFLKTKEECIAKSHSKKIKTFRYN